MPLDLPSPRRSTRRTALIISIPLLAALAYLTLWPTRVEDRMPTVLDLVLGFFRDRLAWTWMGFDQLELLANVLVFVPVGILAFMVIPRRAWPAAYAVGPALSIAIETWQAVALPERAATTADILANSAGATIGVSLSVLAALLIPRRPTLETS
ncbi:VanZ family protein [Microbacterium sp. NPDC055903]